MKYRLLARMLIVISLLSWPQLSSAAGTWSVISLPQEPGEVVLPQAIALDAAGNLYVADQSNGGRIQKRDADGSWAVLAIAGEAAGQVQRHDSYPMALAVDGAGTLYVADQSNRGRVQKRDAQGNWTVIAPFGFSRGQVAYPTALAVDAVGNLYVADQGIDGGIQKRDAQGRWSLIAPQGTALGQVSNPNALAVDTAGNLYVADLFGIKKRDAQGNWSMLARGASALAVDTAGNLYVVAGGEIQKRDAQGNWSVLTIARADIGQVFLPTALVADSAGNLYVADRRLGGRIQKRDPGGNWSVTAGVGQAPGQIYNPSAAAVDLAGNLYVADGGPAGYQAGLLGRIQKRDGQGNWSVLATAGAELGQVTEPSAVAVDRLGNLYVADRDDGRYRIQKRDAQGNWSVVAPEEPLLLGGYKHNVGEPTGLAVDTASNLYIADLANGPRIQKRDAQGNWFVIATEADALGNGASALAVDTGDNLYVLGSGIQKRDTQGNWSVIVPAPTTIDPTFPPDELLNPSGLAVDAAGNLYVAALGPFQGRIHQRDDVGNWSILAPSGFGSAPGQVLWPRGLAVDAAGDLYVVDTGNDRVLKYTPQP